ncbi:putative pentatricopeptide repeat-containing protein At3g08820 isoform X1 [Humulus lupulus]|uniref:putative pentatricopeptide repeat-containing protein At3g08820 isoform X1 n=1 Tax=Humulus lupulus TaxID=3486 RepID=UPI002B412F3F|nr:putative pentatricopeptide repeat-containing protein At3g08820 isoform X1 [Humulus lupulus]XP_062094889.1 putative pentatricopeptide repeat-containing protein At3g08820 isoform X1 [Humulus lupulus]XP_062094891.1 putative pentatricopeptide repeat-containing protein At3g08820 isoform X1 [Humulus lupulus]XP_062094892.1 putative pentatricopeptide repeat-containing protein At3g08820 isoform X1 [Humulus lupulus]XP_062094893.1 putative pentatricopeptide repeat-containing protein At3g08820 isoform X
MVEVLSSNVIQIKTHLLQGFNSFNQLKHVHARLFRLGLDQDNYLLNQLLHRAFGFGKNTRYPRLIFHKTKEPNIYLWNTMIQGLVSADCFDDVVAFYRSMQREGILADSFTYPLVLKACARLCDIQLGLRIHTLVVKSGFEKDAFVSTSLLGFYAKSGYLENAHMMFDETPDKNVVSWTIMINGYISAGRFNEAISMFRRSIEMGVRPNGFNLVRVLSACTRLGDLSSAEWIDQYMMENGLGRNLFVATSLVDVYAKCGNMDKACRIFDGMLEKDVVSWSTMIQGYVVNGLPREGVNLFLQMLKENIKPDCFALVGMFSACARLGALELGEWASNLIDRNEVLSIPVLGTALIDMHAKCGNMVKAWELFKGMKHKDLVVWNAAIYGLAMNGYVEAAFGLFGQMEKSALQPDETTFIGLLSGCAHAGLVDDGHRFFHSISSLFSLTPSIEHYGCMVDLLSRAGLLGEAYKLIKSMPMKANAIVWGALLGGCRLHRDTELAENVLEQLIELEPWSSGNYILLSNIYSANRKWNEAANIRSIMNEQGIQKIRGCSWVELDGVIHEFLVGDKSHPLSEKMYAKLDELEQELKSAGYVPTTEFTLFDIEEEEKEHFLRSHSEKLAIAFVLISTTSKDLIRVVKNLRVCGDCHEFIKLVSKITGRKIIVRDNNIFHRFIDGLCSCKDYW